MTTNGIPFRRLRMMLDCTLIFLLILIVIANYLPVQAKTRYQPFAPDAINAEAITLSNHGAENLGLASVNPSHDLVLPDNNLLAAMIAAENAALTLPQYFIDLPMISR